MPTVLERTSLSGDETPQGGGPVYDWPWEDRIEYVFDEPTVAGGGLPIRFHFSIDPWAVGLAGTAVQNEATNQGALTLPVGPYSRRPFQSVRNRRSPS